MYQEQKGRVVGLFWLLTLYALLLGGRLFRLQYLEHGKYKQRAEAQQLGRAELSALRGEIRDRNGVVLAKSLARPSVATNPQRLQELGGVEEAVQRLSSCLELDSDELRTALESPTTFRWVARKISQDQALKIKAAAIDGVFVTHEVTPGRRYYPKGRLASPILGFTGIDDQGLDGLEASYNRQLSGSPGFLHAFMDLDGWATIDDPAAAVRRAQPGHHVILTIDESIQFVAQRELDKQVEAYHAEGGIVMVLDARTAEVLALAISPGFPAQDFSSVSPGMRRNRALTDPYEPGSTFKVFLAAAALEAGVSVDSKFPSGGVLRVDGWNIYNANDGLHAGALETLTDILAFSFNIGTSNVALHIGREAFYRSLVGFGFGRRTGINLMGESEGLMTPGQDWADINTATISFGQGIACTPLQLVSAMQAIANGGVRVKPRIVRAIVDSEGSVVERFESEVIGRSCSAKTSKQVLEILENVCVNGTGKRAQVQGFRVGGKTGTAQLVENGVYSADKFIASFLGVAPVDDPRVVVLVKIEKPSVQWGGTVAAPVFSRVTEKALWKLGVPSSQHWE